MGGLPGQLGAQFSLVLHTTPSSTGIIINLEMEKIQVSKGSRYWVDVLCLYVSLASHSKARMKILALLPECQLGQCTMTVCVGEMSI